MMMIPGKRAPAGTIRGKLSPTGVGGEGHRFLRDQDVRDCGWMDGNDSVTVGEGVMMMRTMLMISILL